MEFLVVDSSALITLAGADAVSLLRLWPANAWTVPEVYLETVELGLAKGYPDAGVIADSFREEIIRIKAPKNRRKLPGISDADSSVILLAEELCASRLLVNDQLLLKRAEERGVPARFTAEFVNELHDSGAISRRHMTGLLETFVERRRYSEEFVNALLRR